MTPLDKLSDLRERIDAVDASLIRLLAERFALTETVGTIKAENGLSAEDAERERWQRERYAALATSHRLRVDVALQVMGAIVELVKNRHVALAEPASRPRS